ncbi:xyloglucan galactosyltransferase [Castilleja foliolosa]|uniref:Xyloglucan galactosyltransferase n=1 Tax=Castilleja foliolosa TaxID=1961234 RepID=A0ABD3DU81_9LAMI
MKKFSNPKPKNPFACPESMYQPTPPRISRGLFENVRLSGRSIGASMMLDGGDSGESPGSCNINIYINNDIQGVNNSVLIGSEVKMGDPGVRLCLEGLKMDRGFRMISRKKDWDSLILLVGFMIMVFSFCAYLLI